MLPEAERPLVAVLLDQAVCAYNALVCAGDVKFWDHEWQRHGTCTGMVSRQADQRASATVFTHTSMCVQVNTTSVPAVSYCTAILSYTAVQPVWDTHSHTQ